MLVSLAWRNLSRRRQRTVLTATTVAVSAALLVVALAWLAGIFGSFASSAEALCGHVRVARTDYVDAEETRPLWASFEVVDGLLGRIRGLPGVTLATPRISTPVTVEVGGMAGRVYALAVGTDLAYLERWVARVPQQGRWPEADGELVLGAGIARAAGLELDEDVALLGQTQDGALSVVRGRVVGLVETDNPSLDGQIWMTLARAQYLADTPGAATEILVFGESRSGARDLASAIRDQVDDNTLVVDVWSERDPFAGVLQVIDVVRGLLVTLVVGIAALAVWNTTTMAALERTAEIGVLRALGMSRVSCVVLLVGEAWASATVGGAVGIGGGCAGAWVLVVHGLDLGGRVTSNLGVPLASRIHAVLTPDVPAVVLVLVLVLSTVGALPAALRAARLAPVIAISGRR